MSNNFKFYINSYNYDNFENELREVYVFIKNNYFINKDLQSIEELNINYSENIKEFIESELYKDYFSDLFDDLDKKFIEQFQPKIIFINENIYEDDNIETIKFKFIKNFNLLESNSNKEICYEELYLFGITKKTYNPLEIYNILTNFGKNKLTKEILFDYLCNLNEQKYILDKIGIKDFYEYEDLHNIDLKDINIFKSIGQYINSKLNFSYSINPYKITKFNKILLSLINNSINTINGNNLFDYNLSSNSLFVNLFGDVNEFINVREIDNNEIMMKLYYPLLIEKDILNNEKFKKEKKNLLKKTQTFIEDSGFFVKKNNLTNILHEIHYNSESIINKVKGIKNINFNIHSKLNLNISLDSLFKLINSNKKFPFIKFNPGNKVENIYRFYCDKISKNNKKIPFIKREKIIKYLKNNGKPNTIMIMINIDNEIIKDFILELDNNGVLNIKMEFNSLIKMDELNSIVKKYVNNFFKNLAKNIPNLYNNINLFDNLFDANIEILNIDYKIMYINSFGYNLNEFNKIKTCVSNLLNSSEKSDKSTLKYFRYKKVSNYNETDAITAFIIENIKMNYSPIDIVNNLKDEFNFKSLDEAKKTFENVIQSLNLVENIFNYKKLKIKNNPGFFVSLEKNGNTLEIEVSSIDNINYIKFINLYFDSLLKIILSSNGETNILNNVEYTICKSSTRIAKEKLFTQDNVEDFDNNKINKNLEKIEGNEIDLDDILSVASEPNDDLLDILLDDDDDEYENEDDEEDNYEESDKHENSKQIEKSENSIGDKKEINNDTSSEDDYDEIDYNEDEFKEKDDKENNNTPNNEEDSEVQTKTGKPRANKTKYELNRLGNYETTLFKNYNKKTMVKDENNFFTQYSRSCQHKRQPIIITQQEKDEIDKISPGSYKYILEYSTNNDKKFYYICPHFWDKNRNISLTKEQVKSGEFGKIGDNILDRKKELLPRLMSKNFEGLDKDFCLPCCYSFPKKPYDLSKDKKTSLCLKKTKNRLEKEEKKIGNLVDSNKSAESKYESENSNDSNSDYSNNSEDEDYSVYETNKDSISNTLKKIYITTEFRPILEKGKVSVLPMIVSNFLQYDTTLCFEKGEGNFLKSGHRCLLRYGVEKTIDNNQTFVSCICDAYSKYKNFDKTMKVNDFKKMLISNLTIDDFVNYNNGNLTHIFLSKNIDEEFLSNIEVKDSYKESRFYKNLNFDNNNQVNLYKKIIISYENFKKYIGSNKHIIDHTYLWDIICKPNKNLFEEGINLIILDITNEDITQNIKVLCPKSSYSNEFIDENKQNLLLIKNNNIFEPIYAIKDTSVEKRVISLFDFDYNKDEIYFVEFKKILNILKDNLNEKCISDTNIEKYDFKKNISLKELIKTLYKLKYEIVSQIMNYENKIIGVIVYSNDLSYFIPCYPSNSDTENNINIQFMDDGNIKYNSYMETKNFLEKIYEDSKHKIIVKPRYKILEEGLIVGILTNGDQFVLISPYEIYNQEDGLEVLKENNYLIQDKEYKDSAIGEKEMKNVDLLIQTNYNKDEERKKIVSNIKLESGFYNSFKNTVKEILKNPLNNNVLIKIQKIVSDYSILYFEKLRLIEDELKSISQNKIIFIDYDESILQKIKTISLCLNNDCDTDFCMKNPDETCSLIVQKTNLITNKDNEEIYYVKLADEFIRNTKTKIFLFENKNIGIGNIRYNIDKNELVMLHSSINNDLFDKKNIIKNDYENYTNIDEFTSENKIVLDEIDTKKFKPKQKNISLDNIQQDKKIKIKIPKLKMESIKELEEKLSSKRDKTEKTEKTEKIEKIEKIEKPEKTEEKNESENESINESENESINESENESINESDIEDFEKNKDDVDIFISKISDTCKSKIENNILRESGIKENFSVEQLYNIYFTLLQQDDIYCSYELFILLIKHFNNNETYNDLDVNTLKNELIEEYFIHENCLGLLINSYQYVYNDTYMKFWGDESYKNILETLVNKKYKTKDLTQDELKELIQKIINNDKYYLSYIDIYLLSKKYNIPLIFITSSVISINSIKSSTNIKKFMICNINKETDNYYFIKLPSVHYRGIMKINQLIHKENSITINIKNDINNYNNMNNEINESILSNEDQILEAAINTEKITEKTKVLKKYNISTKKM